MKSDTARLTTRRFDGVRSVLVFVKIKITQRFPRKAIAQNKAIENPSIECQSGFIGGNWYLKYFV